MLHSPQRLSVTEQRVGTRLSTGVPLSVLQKKERVRPVRQHVGMRTPIRGELRARRIMRRVRSGMDSPSFNGSVGFGTQSVLRMNARASVLWTAQLKPTSHGPGRRSSSGAHFYQ
jgi:hypothetical protein